MLPRAGAAILALTAVFLLAFSVITSSWWAGHPSFGGHEQNRLVVNIGLLGGEGCKLDSEAGADVCEALELGVGFLATGYIELAATGMLAFAALALAVMSLRGKSTRKTFAKIVLAAAGASAIVAAALLIQGPDVKTKASFDITLPIGYGMFVFWIGVVASTAAGVVALRPSGAVRPRTARPVWATSGAAPPPSDKGAQPAVDVLALLQEDQLRPSKLGPEPMIGAPAGSGDQPLARPSPPLFQGAPQLKPLYEVPGAAFVPPPPPQLPTRGPTPMPRAAVSAVGVPTPPIAGGGPPFSPPAFDAALRPKTLPPPLRGKGTTAPPPLPNAIVRPNPLALARTEPQLEAMRGNHSPIAGGGPPFSPPALGARAMSAAGVGSPGTELEFAL